MAGPGIEQTVPLFLHFFPGDGEAILGVGLHADSADVSLAAAHSSLGRARATATGVEVDYRWRPIGREQVDTLQLTLVARSTTAIVWRSDFSSTADSASNPGAAARLAIAPPLSAALSLEPERVFAGEQVSLRAVLSNTDSRPLTGVLWQWPAGLSVGPDGGQQSWNPPLDAGSRDTLVWQARVEGQAAGQLALQGRLEAAEVSGSPVKSNPLLVLGAPRVEVNPVGDAWLAKGRSGRVLCKLANPGTDTLWLDAWRVELPATFTRVKVLRQGQGRAVVAANEVQVLEMGSLAPGQSADLELETVAERSGPFNLNCGFRPAHRRDFIAAGGQTVLRVAEENNAAALADSHRTDLELLRLAFSRAADQALAELPLAPGTRVCLEPFEKADKNWVLDDALLAVLMRQGYEVLLKPEAAAALLRYRLADSRVVYTPAPSGWNPFGRRQRREAYGEVYLRLEDRNRRITWSKRVQAYQADVVAGGQAGSPTASALFKSTRVEDQHKGIERGLSASILGGLFYIFFIP